MLIEWCPAATAHAAYQDPIAPLRKRIVAITVSSTSTSVRSSSPTCTSGRKIAVSADTLATGPISHRIVCAV